jgi:predicted GH43/DUF377 family glycosyl hydrolase
MITGKRYWIGGLLIALLSIAVVLGQQIQKIKQKQKLISQSLKQLRYVADASSSMLGSAPVPHRLSNLLSGEELGIVVGVKRIVIRNVVAYNPTLVWSKTGYDLFFRYDVVSAKAKTAPFCPCIGVVHLDSQFEQTDQEFQRIDLKTDYAEDPRVIEVGNQLYLIYNDLDQTLRNGRFVAVANLDRDTYQANYITPLDLNLQYIEKNWSPFEYLDENLTPHLFLEYKIHPRKILRLPDPRLNELHNITLPRDIAFRPLAWPHMWGEMRGGAPAKKIGDEYLGFFHSCFTEQNGLVWFAMGAYTFENSPPFRLTSISNHPILFKGIFDTPLTHTAPVNKRVIYPGGFVYEKQGDMELVHVACGENDCGIKIVTMNLKNLKKNLIRL